MESDSVQPLFDAEACLILKAVLAQMKPDGVLCCVMEWSLRDYWPFITNDMLDDQ